MELSKALILNEIKRYYNFTSDAEFARFLDITPQNLKHWYSRDTYNLHTLVGKCVDINPQWIMTGEGEMLKESENNLLQSENIKYKLVPLYNLDAVGGIENDAVDIKPYISEYIPFRDARDTDICIPVSGKSMMPTYSPGTIILIRQLFDWQSYTELGQIYVLVLKDGRRLLKEIKRSEENTRDNFLLYSHNPEFQPTEIPKSIITDIYLVIALYQKTTM